MFFSSTSVYVIPTPSRLRLCFCLDRFVWLSASYGWISWNFHRRNSGLHSGWSGSIPESRKFYL